MLRRHEEGDERLLPFRRRPSANRPGVHADPAGSTDQRSGAGGGSRSGDDGDLIAVYEFFAATYGWFPDDIERRLTDSQIAEYLDRAATRREKEAQADLDLFTLAVNNGTLITYDRDALRKWQSRHRRPQAPSDFSSTVNRLARMFPEKVKTH